jgi:IclR family mhp operon transcriptional activator
VRLLDTLIAAGYVRNDLARKGYCLQPAVQELSAGYHGGPLLIEAGAALCGELTARVKWPVSIAVLDGTEMTVCFSTLRDSPVQPFGKILAKRRSLLMTGLGRAYLAFCPADERAILTAMLRDEAPAATRRKIDAAVEDAVSLGAAQDFIERDPAAPADSTSTLAMPIRAEGRVLGTVGLTYFLSAIERDDVARVIAAPLREVVTAIGKNATKLMAQRLSTEAHRFPPRRQPARRKAKIAARLRRRQSKEA